VPAGTADLTAHVDFERLGVVAKAAGSGVHGPVPQGLFLARLGLFQRTNQLARHLPPRAAAAMMEGARRLAEPDRMGRLFKAIALLPPGAGTPPGFE
jgi:SAM-dependent MidA family methyltransferase